MSLAVTFLPDIPHPASLIPIARDQHSPTVVTLLPAVSFPRLALSHQQLGAPPLVLLNLPGSPSPGGCGCWTHLLTPGLRPSPGQGPGGPYTGGRAPGCPCGPSAPVQARWGECSSSHAPGALTACVDSDKHDVHVSFGLWDTRGMVSNWTHKHSQCSQG